MLNQCTATFDQGRCPKEVQAKDLCPGHYQQQRKGKELKPLKGLYPKICKVSGCKRRSNTRNMCTMHQLRLDRTGKTGGVESTRNSTLDRDSEGNKRCHTCKEWKVEQDFSTGTRSLDGLNRSCRTCSRARYIKSQYNVPMDWESKQLETYGGCQICRVRVETPGIKWHVDHNHACCPGARSCGKCVRGILCPNCNQVLGRVKDSSETLRNMINYLEKYKMDEPQMHIRGQKFNEREEANV